MSRDLSAAHLRRLKLTGWSHVDSEELRTCFSIVSRYSSVEELEVSCDTPGEHCLVAESPMQHMLLPYTRWALSSLSG